jgi:hypothetical protein
LLFEDFFNNIFSNMSVCFHCSSTLGRRQFSIAELVPEEPVAPDESKLEGNLQCARALAELSLRPRLRATMLDENVLNAFAVMLALPNKEVRFNI